jgi:signal transduction histidine kinase
MKIDFTSDINKDYTAVMNYERIDRFIVRILWWHFAALILLAFANCVLQAAHYYPSPFSWRLISWPEALGAIVIGLAAALIPTWVRSKLDHHYLWRIFISVALTTYSYLFVFVSGGSIEMHFHFFMIMALLVIYADWRLEWIVLILTALHHGILNYLQPEWVYFYGRNDISVIAHALPVLTTAIFTTLLCQNHRNTVERLSHLTDSLTISNEKLERAHYKTNLELIKRKQIEEALRHTQDQLEHRVQERTAELFQANATLVQQIAERKQLEKQLHQAQKMEALGRLTGGIAHDFNNLLTAIIGFTELIGLQTVSDNSTQELVSRVLSSSQRAATLVRQLLTFSRRQIIEPQILDLNLILADIGKMLRRIIGEPIEVKTLLQPNLWSIKGDAAQLEQVIVNLAVNARDAMPNGGQLLIETTNVILDEGYTAGHLEVQPGEYVLLAVSDTGIGMTEEVKTHLFEPYFTTKEEGKGTGLGLAIVYGIVKQSGGEIWVYSELGQGTTFKIYLPRVEAVPQFLIHPEAGTALPRGTETVLLVEDDPEVRTLARLILHGQGYTLLEAENGQEALRLLSRYSGPIHLVLTDVIMPGMNGKTLIEKMSQVQSQSKALFMSGYTDNVMAQHGVLEPGLAFLQKPFGPTDLVCKVRQVLDS